MELPHRSSIGNVHVAFHFRGFQKVPDFARSLSDAVQLNICATSAASESRSQNERRIERFERIGRPRGVDLTSEQLPFGRLWYGESDDAIGYTMHYSRSHDTV